MRPSYNPKEVIPGGRPYITPGVYLVEVTDIREEATGDKPYTEFDLLIRDGKNKDQINRVFPAKYYWYHGTANAERMNQEMIALFADTLGVMSLDDQSIKVAAGEDVEFDWSGGIKKRAIIQIQDNEYNGRVTSRIGHQLVWPATSKEGLAMLSAEPTVTKKTRAQDEKKEAAKTKAEAAEVF